MTEETTPERNIGECIAYLYYIKQKKARINKITKKLTEMAEATEQLLIKKIKDQGVEGLHSNGISATVSEETFGNIKDYEAFETYLKETDSLFILQRRLSQVAVRDLWNSGETIPGVEAFTKTTLSLSKR